MRDFDLAERTVRELNAALHGADEHKPGDPWEVRNPRGAHAVAVGINSPATVNIHGHVGYYCAGMNQQATVVVSGNAGVGVAEKLPIAACIHCSNLLLSAPSLIFGHSVAAQTDSRRVVWRAPKK